MDDMRKTQLHTARVINRIVKREQKRYEEAVDAEDWSIAAARRSYRNGVYRALFIICLRLDITTEELEADGE